MLAGEWEQYATELSMPLTKNKFKIRLESILARTNIHINKSKARVFVATDTRESSPGLYEALLAGLNSLKTEHKYYGVQTTPLLHYMVRTSNLHSGPGKPLHIPNENLYYEQFSRAYVNLLGAAFGGEIVSPPCNSYSPRMKYLCISLFSKARRR